MMLIRQIIFGQMVFGLFVVTPGKPMIPNIDSMFLENLGTKLTFVRPRTDSIKTTDTTQTMIETTTGQPISEIFENIPKQNSTQYAATYIKSLKASKSTKAKSSIDSVGEILRRYVRL
jgi:phage terminase large subunit GpA-like protein